jgi:tetratricopeptide (TPR) repeat protein
MDFWGFARFAKGVGKGAARLATAWRRWGQEDRAEIEDTYKNELACLQEQLNEADSEEEKARIKQEIKVVRDEQRLFYRARRDLLLSKALVERMTPKGGISAGAPELPASKREALRIAMTVLEQLEPGVSFADRFLRGTAFYVAQDFESALREYNAALELRPDDPDTLNNRGATLDGLKRYDDALTDFNRSLELRPDHPNTLNSRGAALGDLGRYEDALADFNRSLELHPDDPDTLYNRGTALGRLKRYEEALRDLNRSLKLRPDHPRVLSNRGVTLRHLDRSEEALADHNRAVGLAPDDPIILGSRGVALRHLNRYEEALADFNRSLELRPDHLDATYNIACLYSLWQRYEESLQWLEKAIAGDAKYRPMAREDEDFEGLRNHPEWGQKFWELVGTEDKA